MLRRDDTQITVLYRLLARPSSTPSKLTEDLSASLSSGLFGWNYTLQNEIQLFSYKTNRIIGIALWGPIGSSPLNILTPRLIQPWAPNMLLRLIHNCLFHAFLCPKMCFIQPWVAWALARSHRWSLWCSPTPIPSIVMFSAQSGRAPSIFSASRCLWTEYTSRNLSYLCTTYLSSHNIVTLLTRLLCSFLHIKKEKCPWPSERVLVICAVSQNP